MKHAFALLSLVLVSACGGPTPETPALSPSASAPLVGSLPCDGARLPLTGACASADAALFGSINPTRGLFDPKCVWRTNEIALGANDALVFRDQDCSAAGWATNTYRYVAETGLIARRSDAPADDAGVTALKLFPLDAGETPEQAALKTLELAPPDQRSRCAIKPATRTDVVGAAFTLDPTEDLQRELDTANQGDIYDACGPYGFTDADIFWEARPGRALFHALGQDDPYWDPKSFTFYIRDAAGGWRRGDS